MLYYYLQGNIQKGVERTSVAIQMWITTSAYFSSFGFSEICRGNPLMLLRINLSLVIELTDINNFVSYWEFYRKFFLASNDLVDFNLFSFSEFWGTPD